MAAAALLLQLVSLMGAAVPSRAAGRMVQIVALGDSLTAGYMLPANAAFPAVLEKVLNGKGREVIVANAGVSGETTSDGLSRLDWSVPDGTDAVIVELGANDMLRGLDPVIPERALTEIITRLQKRKIKVLLTGMVSVTTYGPAYKKAFDAIYPSLAKKFGVPLYPFFLQGIAGNPRLNLPDGLHPNPAGVKIVVANILPSVEALVAQVRP